MTSRWPVLSRHDLLNKNTEIGNWGIWFHNVLVSQFRGIECMSRHLVISVTLLLFSLVIYSRHYLNISALQHILLQSLGKKITDVTSHLSPLKSSFSADLLYSGSDRSYQPRKEFGLSLDFLTWHYQQLRKFKVEVDVVRCEGWCQFWHLKKFYKLKLQLLTDIFSGLHLRIELSPDYCDYLSSPEKHELTQIWLSINL